LTGKPRFNGGGNGARSGALALALLATPLNPLLLKALADGPKSQLTLRQETGSPAQSTLRTQLKRLEEIGAVEKSRREGFPGTLEYELTPAGRSLLRVSGSVERWLKRAPRGPLPLGAEAAKSALKALAEAWSTTMLRALATGPLSLTELDRVITTISYPSLERRLSALRLAGGIETTRANGRGTPNALTNWAREGIGPIVASVRWEKRYAPEAVPFGRVDAEAAFLLAVPLLRIEERLTGVCRLAMSVPGAKGRRLAGVLVELNTGRVESCTSRLDGTADSWALGSAGAWLEALVEGDPDHIEVGGDGRLPRALLAAMHGALFRDRAPAGTTEPA
jgi:DNA-binding HxlR family transcriptional regulator